MNLMIKTSYTTMLLAVSLATLAVPTYADAPLIDTNWLGTAVAAEVESDGHEFMNQGEEDRLRHRLNENENDKATRTRNEHRDWSGDEAGKGSKASVSGSKGKGNQFSYEHSWRGDNPRTGGSPASFGSGSGGGRR